MASTETGWTDKYPHKADAGDEYYFVRRKDRNEVVVMGFSMGKAWLNGVSYEPSELHTHLFLGPLSPSDAEQLMELRRVGKAVLDTLETYKERHLVPPHFLNALADLRDALAGVDRTATVQCADCLAWFDKDTNHTCGKQVRANQRYSGGSNV